MALSNMDFFLICVAIFLPPVPVLLKRNCGADFLINIVLTLLCFLPGMIHSIYIIFKYNDVDAAAAANAASSGAVHKDMV